MGLTLVATSIVFLTCLLTHIGFASTIIIVLIEFHAYVNLNIVVVVIVATSTTFK